MLMQLSSHNCKIAWTAYSGLSSTSHTSLPCASILLLPTASKTSSSGLPSTEYTKRFVLGCPMPPANSCHVGVSMVVWHAVIALKISPCLICALSPLPPAATSSMEVMPGAAASCPRTIPSGRGACTATMLDFPLRVATQQCHSRVRVNEAWNTMHKILCRHG